MKPHAYALWLLMLAWTLAGCSQAPETAATDGLHTLRIGGAELAVELALTPEEQATGLMHRDSLPQDQGMLFVFPTADKRSFWMANVRFPISLAYIKPDGTIAEIYDMRAYDRSGQPSFSHSIQYVLEVNKGWFARRGVKEGEKLDLATVAAALEAEGEDPADYRVRMPSTN